MTDFLNNNSIYVVFIITLVIWLGIAIYIFLVDKKITKLENEVEFLKENKEEK